MTARVTVITVTYADRWEHVSATITSVLRTRDADIVVVANGAAPHTRDALRHMAAEQVDRVTLIEHEHNLGSAPAFAAALAVAYERGTAILILDDDNPLGDHSLEELEGIEEALRERGEGLFALSMFRAVNPVNIARRDGAPLDSLFVELMPGAFNGVDVWAMLGQRLPRALRSPRQDGKRQTLTTPFGTRRALELPNAMWGGLYLPADVAARRPSANTAMVLYGDDNDFSRAIRQCGATIYLCPEVEIVDSINWRDQIPNAGLRRGLRVPVAVRAPSSQLWRAQYKFRNWAHLSVQQTAGRPFVRVRLAANLIAWSIYFLGSGVLVGRPRHAARIVRAAVDGARGRLGYTYPLPGGPPEARSPFR